MSRICKTINLTDMLAVEDITNDCNAADNHFKTGLNLEDVKEEYISDATDETCYAVVGNCENIKEESIEIEETQLEDFIKGEVLDSYSDTGISFGLEQRSQFENGTREMQKIVCENYIGDKLTNCEQVSNSEDCETRNSMEIKPNIDCLDLSPNIKVNDVSSSDIKLEFEGQASITVMQSEGLVEQCSKSDYGKYIVNIESSNSSVICAQSCSKQDNSVTKTPKLVNRMGSRDSFSTATWQRKINARRIAETSDDNSLKEIDKHKSTTKSHFKNGTRHSYRLHKNKKNSNEPIVGTSVLHIDSLQDYKEIVTEMDGSSAREIEVNNYPNYLKCGTSNLNVNIENNTLHPKPRNISALLSSNRFNDDSSQHSDSFSAQVKNYDFLDTIVERPYKCNVCDYASSRKDTLKIHVRSHTGEKPYKCNSCDYASARKGDLRLHVRNHTGEKQYNCNSCDYASSWKSNLKIHMTIHTKEKPYKCKSCDYASSTNGKLKIHMRIHTGEKPYKCNLCDYASSHQNNLKIHLTAHTGEKPYKCNSCDYASSQQNSLKIHMAKHTGEKPFKCNSCDYATFRKVDLRVHVRNHTRENQYNCNSCDFASFWKGNLKIHMTTHAREKPYKCNSCDYASSRQRNLKVHMTKHTGEKPYKCNCCDYASFLKSHLKIHMAKHTREKPYKCNSCDYAGSQRGSLKIHMAKHTGEKPYKCNSCDYASSQRGLLKIHMAKHTGEKPYKCNSCDYASSTKGNLKLHMAKKHTAM